MNRKSALLALLGIAFAGLLTSAPAEAQATFSAVVNVNPGKLEVSGSGGVLKFADTALEINYASAQVVSGSSFSTAPGITISDKRGNAAANGWHVQMSATDFTGSSSTPIPASGFTYTPGSGTVTKVNGPADTVAPAEVTGSALALNAAQTVATATSGNGRGDYTYLPAATKFSLSVPAGTLDGAYTSTLTLTIIAGP